MLQHILQLAKPYLDSYGYGALFVLVFIEGFGIPAPGETMIIAGGLLAYQGRMDIGLVLPIAWAAAVLGDNLGFAIGHFGGRPLILRFGDRFGIHAEQLSRVESFFDRYGGPVVALARFVDGPRQLNGLVAGSSGMNWWRFLTYNALGAGLWVGLWGGGVYLLGSRIESFLVHFKRAEHWAIAVLLLGLAVLLFSFLHKRWRNKS